MQSLSFVSYFITMSFILYYYIPHLLSTGKVKTTNKRPYVGVNGTVEGLVIQSDRPLCYEEGGEFPPYEGIDADTLGGKPASDYVLDSELTEALAGKADATHTHEIAQVNGLQNQLNGKANSSHTHTVSQITDMPDLANAVPSGIICMWSGESTAIPSGWHLCDGTQNTPDLRNRFIVGAGSTYGVGDTGGEATHKLTTNEMPAHNHRFTGTSHSHTGSLSNATANSAGMHDHTVATSNITSTKQVAHGNGETVVNGTNTNDTTSRDGAHTHNVTGKVTVNSATAGGTVGSTGGGQAHENRPPYYALCFIMKL